MSALAAIRSRPASTRVLLADEAGFIRTALATALCGTPSVELVAVMNDGRALGEALMRLRPDVLVIDDRLLGRNRRLPLDVGARVIVIGVDDDPGYAARARRAGAVAWVPKDRIDLLVAAILGSSEGAEKYGADPRPSADDGRGTTRSVGTESIPADQGDSVPNTIVIGSDGSAQADAALQFGGTLASALGARVVVVSAYVHSPPLRGDAGSFEAVMRQDAHEIARRGAAAIDGVSDVAALASYGATIAEALHRAAQAEGADLLVVSTSGRRRIAGHQLGSISERVAHESPRPVAVIPPRDSAPRITSIGVAVAGTPAARAALDFARRCWRSRGATPPRTRRGRCRSSWRWVRSVASPSSHRSGTSGCRGSSLPIGGTGCASHTASLSPAKAGGDCCGASCGKPIAPAWSAGAPWRRRTCRRSRRSRPAKALHLAVHGSLCDRPAPVGVPGVHHDADAPASGDDRDP
jgi:nucleotide-binding universal stress UspA family protein